MKVFVKTCAKQSLLSALCIMVLLSAGFAQSAEPATGIAGDGTFSVEAVQITPNFTFNITSITEGIKDLPLERQLTNFIPFDSDFTIIRTWGYNADKLKIELEDEEAFGDRLMAIAVAFYQYHTQAFWGSVFSNSSSGNSFVIEIPSFSPGIVVWLWSGYQRPSVGENPYKYRITLSYPR
jgi:hypothetical protein